MRKCMEITKSNHDSMSGKISCSALYTPVFGMSDVCMSCALCGYTDIVQICRREAIYYEVYELLHCIQGRYFMN